MESLTREVILKYKIEPIKSKMAKAFEFTSREVISGRMAKADAYDHLIKNFRDFMDFSVKREPQD